MRSMVTAGLELSSSHGQLETRTSFVKLRYCRSIEARARGFSLAKWSNANLRCV